MKKIKLLVATLAASTLVLGGCLPLPGGEGGGFLPFIPVPGEDTSSTSSTSRPTGISTSGGQTSTTGGGQTSTTTTGGGGSSTSTTQIPPGPGTNYGTADNPITPAEAKAIIDAGDKHEMYVGGVVKSNAAWSTQYSNIDVYLEAGDITFEFFRAKFGSSVDNPSQWYDANSMVGKTVVAKGTGKKYNTTYELDQGCEIISVTGGDIPPAGDNWDTSTQALMKEHLDGVVLPFVEGTWDWDYDSDSDVVYGESVDSSVAKVEAALAKEFTFLEEDEGTNIYGVETEKGIVVAYAYEYQGVIEYESYLYEEPVEGEWNSSTQALMKEHLAGNVLPYVEGTWSWAWYEDYESVVGQSTDATDTAVIEALTAAKYVPEQDDSGDTIYVLELDEESYIGVYAWTEEGTTIYQGFYVGEEVPPTPPTGDEVTIDTTVEAYATANNWADATKYTTMQLDSVVTATAAGTDANTGKYYSNGQQWRFYQTGAATLTISAASGYTIKSITVTYVSQNTGIFTEAASGTPLEVNAASIILHVGNSGTATNGQARVTAISVTYVAA